MKQLFERIKNERPAFRRHGKRRLGSALLLTFLLLGLMGVSTTVFAQANQLVDTIYHVYVDGEHAGAIKNEEIYQNFVTEKLHTYKESFPYLSLKIGEEVEIIPEFVFNPQTDTEATLLF